MGGATLISLWQTTSNWCLVPCLCFAEQYFRDEGVTLNERFSAPQKGGYSEKETEELTLDERFSSSRCVWRCRTGKLFNTYVIVHEVLKQNVKLQKNTETLKFVLNLVNKS